MESKYHESVMVSEAVGGLLVKNQARYIDATVGNGGHALEIIRRGGRVLGIDLDPKMIEIARARIGKTENVKLVQGNFVNIDSIAREGNRDEISGILFDLGVTNIHLKDLERGFSFGNEAAELDMRIDPTGQAVKAKDLLNVLREDQLRQMFEVTLDPGAAKWVTGRVLHSRTAKPMETVADMLEVTRGLKTGRHGISEATLPFLALRIAVNSELDNLKEALPKAFGLLKGGGRLVVISFHSKEDKIVKDFFKEKSEVGKAKLITFKPVEASAAEIEENRRSRSAKMRVLEKI